VRLASDQPGMRAPMSHQMIGSESRLEPAIGFEPVTCALRIAPGKGAQAVPPKSNLRQALVSDGKWTRGLDIQTARALACPLQMVASV